VSGHNFIKNFLGRRFLFGGNPIIGVNILKELCVMFKDVLAQVVHGLCHLRYIGLAAAHRIPLEKWC